MVRPIATAAGVLGSKAVSGTEKSDRPYGTGCFFLTIPGTSCLATFTQSLQDGTLSVTYSRQ
jgi:hypothetical protein